MQMIPMLVKASDLNTEIHGIEIASKWVERLFEEFALQVMIEKQLGLVCCFKLIRAFSHFIAD